MTITESTKKNLPWGWRWVQLGEVCDINPRRQGMIRPDFEPTSFVPMEAVDAQKGVICEVRQRPFVEVKKGYTYFQSGDVLFAKITPCMQNGKHAIGHNLIDGIGFASTEFHVIRPLKGILSEWVHYFVRQPAVLDDATNHFTGAVGQQRVPDDFLKSLKIPLPAPDTQKRVTTILNEQMTAVEKARVAAKARLEAIRQLVPTYYREAFGEFLPFAASPLTPTKPSLPGWRWYRLTDLARLATGHTPSRYHPEYWKGEIPWIQLADIRELDGREAFETSEHTNTLGIENSAAVLLPKGTVCMSRTASVGFFTIMGRTMATSQDFVNWICGNELHPWFLMHLLIASRKAIRALGSGAVHHTIYFPTVKAFSICVPPLSKQQRIAEVLREQISSVERAVTAAEDELAAINALPAAFLRRAFNGEI